MGVDLNRVDIILFVLSKFLCMCMKTVMKIEQGVQKRDTGDPGLETGDPQSENLTTGYPE